MNSCDYFLWGYLRDRVYHTNPVIVQELLKRSQMTCCLTQLTNFWFVYSESTRQKDLTLNICSHEDHMHINSPLK